MSHSGDRGTDQRPSRRTRVAVVSDAVYPWHKGGKEIRYRELLSRLIDHDMDVTVYTMHWWTKEAAPVVVRGPRGSLTYQSILPRVPMYRNNRRSILAAVLFALATFRLLLRSFDVIEADHMPYLQLIPLRLVSWVRRAPLVVTWNEVWGPEYWDTYLGRLGFLAAWVERRCARLPDTVLALTPHCADKLAVIGVRPERIQVAVVAVDADLMASLAADNTAPDLLFVGRLLSHKRADLAIEATAILASRGLDVRLGIVGVGPEEERLRSQAEALGVAERVVFFGVLESQDEVWSLLKGAHVMLLPSEREGFGLVVAEALVAGTPVVCTDGPDNESQYLVDDGVTGAVVHAELGDGGLAGVLAEAVADWLARETGRDALSASFLERHRDLSWDGTAATYAEALHRGSPPTHDLPTSDSRTQSPRSNQQGTTRVQSSQRKVHS